MFPELLREAKAQKRWSSQRCSIGVRIVGLSGSCQEKEDVAGEICEKNKAIVKRGGENTMESRHRKNAGFLGTPIE